MTTVKFKALGMVLALLLAPAFSARAADPVSHPYAVLVGINEYADKQIKPRPHAEDDAKALYDLFTNKDYLGIEPDSIHLLLGKTDDKRKSEPATRENILKSLKWVAATAKRDDVVIFAFLGEGAPLSESRLCYLACDSTLKDRSKNAVAAADIQQELDKLKSQRFCAFVDVNFAGFKDGPEKVPEPVLTTHTYREFRGVGVDGKEDAVPAPGRVVFLATNGLSSSLDLKEHGVFTQLLLDGLKGGADKDGYEPDGVVTVDELVQYVDKQLPERVREFGKTDEERRQTEHVLESRGTHFVLTHNPAVAAKVAERLKKLDELSRDQKISREVATEGQKLLGQMPKLKVHQALRREYEKLVDGKLNPDDFTKERTKVLDGLKLKRSAAFAYAAKVIQATQVIRDGYVKEINQGDMVAWAVRGLYKQIEEKLPKEVTKRLDKVRDMSEAELTALLADVREELGQREDLNNHRDIDLSLQQMLAHLDPYTTYIDPEMLSRFQQDTTGKFKGIGIQIRENRAKGALQVVTPLMGSPAYKAGFKAGDLITKIIRDTDAEGNALPQPEVISTRGMTTSDAVKQIQGKPGTKVKLMVEREGVDHPLTIEVARSEIQIETVLGINRKENDNWNFYLDPVNKIAYVRLTSFARRSADDLKRVLTTLTGPKSKGINGMVLDLRFNPGGLLTSAVEICDMFLEDGRIVTIRPRVGREASYDAEPKTDRRLLNFPMVVLVNGMSASGSEIVSACLQDQHRAVVMGERSYGKGSVQNIQPFEGGELKLTTASFWRPTGKNLNKSSTHGKEDEDWGVRPNKGYTIHLSEKEREQLYEHQHDSEVIPRRDLPQTKEKKPEFKDKQLDAALEYLRNQIRTASTTGSRKAG
jgi:carboxyl-terminal processing protease